MSRTIIASETLRLLSPFKCQVRADRKNGRLTGFESLFTTELRNSRSTDGRNFSLWFLSRKAPLFYSEMPSPMPKAQRSLDFG